MSDELVEAWLGLALDPIQQQCYVLNLAHTEAEALKDKHLVEATYFKAVKVADTMGHEILDWLTKQGVPATEAPTLIQEIGRAVLRLMQGEEDDAKIRGNSPGEIPGEDDVPGCGGGVSGGS